MVFRLLAPRKVSVVSGSSWLSTLRDIDLRLSERFRRVVLLRAAALNMAIVVWIRNLARTTCRNNSQCSFALFGRRMDFLLFFCGNDLVLLCFFLVFLLPAG